MQRNTSQRNAIERAFESTDRPLSPAEVLEIAHDDVPSLGIATVYRNIKRLVEAGELAVVEIAGEPPRFEVAGKHHHHHFHCRKCDKLFEVEGCVGTFRKLTPKGFRLEGHDLLLQGVCAACRRDRS